jgi:phage terminase small subunit
MSFCAEYLIDHNGTQAAIRTGYSAKSAKQQASRHLADPMVKDYLAELAKSVQSDLTITADRVLKELARIAFHDPQSYFTKDSRGRTVLKSMDEFTADQRAAISEFDATTKKLKLYDKLSALDKLGKHLKLFTELHEQQHTFTKMSEVKLNGTVLIFNVGEPKPQN